LYAALALSKAPLANNAAEFAVIKPALACALDHESVAVLAALYDALACAKARFARPNAEGTKEEKSLVESNLDGGTCVDISYSLFILFI